MHFPSGFEHCRHRTLSLDLDQSLYRLICWEPLIRLPLLFLSWQAHVNPVSPQSPVWLTRANILSHVFPSLPPPDPVGSIFLALIIYLQYNTEDITINTKGILILHIISFQLKTFLWQYPHLKMKLPNAIRQYLHLWDHIIIIREISKVIQASC